MSLFPNCNYQTNAKFMQNNLFTTLPKIHPKHFAHHPMSMKRGIVSKQILKALVKQLIYFLGKSTQKLINRNMKQFILAKVKLNLKVSNKAK